MGTNTALTKIIPAPTRVFLRKRTPEVVTLAKKVKASFNVRGDFARSGF
jgi:hypothetical protein